MCWKPIECCIRLLPVVSAMLAACFAPPPLAGAERSRPNLVLIMADDMGYSDVGCYGGEIRTPNLDRLAAGGLRFTHFYNTARCCPTRAALLTGLYPHQAGIGHMANDRGLPGYRGRLGQDCVTIAEALARDGYRTLMSGKWHVTPFDFKTRHASDPATWPLARGFDVFYGTLAGGGSYFTPPGLMRGNQPVQPDSPRYFYTDAVSDEAARLVRSFGTDERPFFLYVAYTSPHWPLHAPEHDVARYEGVYDGGWDALRAQRLARMIEMRIVDARWELSPRDPTVTPWKEAEHKKWQARRMEVYAAQVDNMDQGIGRIVAALEETGQLENTLLMFLADNGGCAEELYADTSWLIRSGIVDAASPAGLPMRVGNDPAVMPGAADTFASYGVPWANASNTPFRLYKHWVHEGGIATPLVVHWPAGISARGELRRQPGHVIDLMATCLDAAGADYPKEYRGQAITPLEGKSLLPAFGDRPIEREALYWEHEGNRAVRVGQWKLVAQHDGPWELYNLEADRTETNSLAAAQPERVRQMITLYNRWATRARVQPWPIRRPKQTK